MSGLKIEKIKRQTTDDKTQKESWVEEVLNFEILPSANKISDKIKEEFYQEFGSLLEAGVDVKTTLDLIASEYKEGPLKKHLNLAIKYLAEGNSLSEAIKKTEAFSPYEYHATQIGEETGKLQLVLPELSKYFGMRVKQRRQMISALAYPSLIFSISLGAVLFMIFYMVPMFNDVFKRFGGKLPAITQFVINFSEGISKNLYIFVVIILILAFFLFSFRRMEWFKRLRNKIQTNLPFFGIIYKSLFFSKFCSSMALLIGSKVHLIRCIELIDQMTNYYPLSKVSETIKKDLTGGRSLYDSLNETKIFDNKLLTMVKIGEEVTQLDVFFDKLGQHYSSELEHRTAMLNTFLEPLLIIFLGIIVGFILITMYLPMFQISTNLGL